jgi:hypothetical protein
MSLSDLTLPILAVNGYLWDTMKQLEPTFNDTYGNTIPFFPLSDSATGSGWESKAYIIYDRIMRTTPNPFYPIKKDHIIYNVKAKDIETLQWGLAVQYILDRYDDAAQDINDWNRNKGNPYKVYFHNLRVYQEDASVNRNFSTRPFYITQFIVESEYHFTESIESILS